jgi:L-cysteine desulfidase
MGVGIPGTGMVGLPIAVALGALVGRSEYSLEVLKETTPQAVEQGKRMIEEKRINVSLKEGACDVLHIEVEAATDTDRAVAVISGSHTNFVFLQRNDEVLLDNNRAKDAVSENAADIELSMHKVWEFAMESPVEELSFILEARRLNKNVAEESLKGKWGHCLGRIISGDARNKIFGDTVFTRMVSYTSAACDARMGGAQMPVMSNSGSGNQGIASTLPVVVYAEETKASEESLIRALVLSHLTVVYIKQSLGRLSALCGCVVASTGSSCGITYLMGGGYDEVAMAVKNMVANLTGVICDGAKPSCALKLASAVSTAMFSSVMAMEHHCVTSLEGIVDDDVDKSIRNLTSIGSQGMQQTDKMILSIMTNK